MVVLAAGMILGWRYPGVCPPAELHTVPSGCPHWLDFAVGIASVGLSAILAVVGWLRDPD